MLLPCAEEGSHQNTLHTDQPFVEIVEQPATQVRYRYLSEKKAGAARFPESIVGVRSTNEHKTSPAIKIHNYKGQAVVVVSCVTKDRPYKPHPHCLRGKEEGDEGFRNGVYSLKVQNTQDKIIQFPNLGIECAKRHDVATSLKERKSIKVDPFGTGFDHAGEPNSIDLNVIRLCFQVFVKVSSHSFAKPLSAVVSTPVHSTRSNHKFEICSLSHASAPVIGDFEMNLLCGRVNKDNIEIHFTENKDGLEVWKGLAKFQPLDIHQHVAIKFRTPSYKDKEVKDPVNVQIRLYRPSDGSYSNSLDFILTPVVKPDMNFRRNSPKTLKEDFVNALMQHQNITPRGHSSSTMYMNRSLSVGNIVPSTSRHAPLIEDPDSGSSAQRIGVGSPMQLYASTVVYQNAPNSGVPTAPTGNGNTSKQSESTLSTNPDVRLYETMTYTVPVPLTSEQASQQGCQLQEESFVELPHFYTLEQMRPFSTIATPCKMDDMDVDTNLITSALLENSSIVDMNTELPALSVELNSTELATIESWCNSQNELSIM